VDIRLATGGLTPTSQTLAVRVTFDRAGLWLETQSGLRLAILASQPNVRRVALLLGPEKDFLSVYAGDDAVVAEYSVRGLGNIVEIDAGKLSFPSDRSGLGWSNARTGQTLSSRPQSQFRPSDPPLG
jgi:hypothetical protein